MQKQEGLGALVMKDVRCLQLSPIEKLLRVKSARVHRKCAHQDVQTVADHDWLKK
jgi:hypothetical protein